MSRVRQPQDRSRVLPMLTERIGACARLDLDGCGVDATLLSILDLTRTMYVDRKCQFQLALVKTKNSSPLSIYSYSCS